MVVSLPPPPESSYAFDGERYALEAIVPLAAMQLGNVPVALARSLIYIVSQTLLLDH